MASVSHEVDNAMQRMLQLTFEQTLKTCAPDSQWSIRQDHTLRDILHDQCVVVTISSFRFRVMCLLHLTLNAATKRFVAAATNTKAEDLDEAAYLDYLLEMSNSLCGNLKRHLQNTCPPLGMSTPNLLDSASLDFNDILDITHGIHVSALADGSTPPIFAASILLSLQNDHGFDIDTKHTYGGQTSKPDNSGELELF